MKVIGDIGPLSDSWSESLSRLLEYPKSSPKQLTSSALLSFFDGYILLYCLCLSIICGHLPSMHQE